MKRMLAIIVAATTLLSLHAAAQNSTLDAGAVINAATTAMGSARLRSVQYTGTGSTNPTGQAYTTGGPWPRFTVTKYTMSIDYATPAMRQELVRIDRKVSRRLAPERRFLGAVLEEVSGHPVVFAGAG